MSSYPVIRVSGTAHERGRQIGQKAAERVRATLDGYRQVFGAYADLGWDEAREAAAAFVEPIRAAGRKYLDEMEGIAAGAGVDLLDIVAVNCRTEIMFAGMARKVLAGERELTPPSECTAFAALPERTAGGGTIIGQNWDWLSFAGDAVIVVVAEQEGAPDYLTVVEAGLLAKSGMNSAGIGVVTNALVSSADEGAPGLPYHVALRQILDSETLDEAANVLASARRSSSANYLIASADGFALDVECTPGGASGIRVLVPEDGYLAHTNHFHRLAPDLSDIVVATRTDTLVRQQSIDRDIRASEAVDVATMTAALSAHGNFPSSVCMHLPEEGHRPMEHSATIASVIMDLDARRAWVASGNPCSSPFQEIGLDGGEQA